MALADPQSITINAVAQSLPRVGSGENSGTFRKDDASVELLVSHKLGNRTRHVVRVNHSKIAVDPLVPTINKPYSMSFTLTVDVPSNGGYSLAEQKQVVDGVLAYLTASSGARITQILGGES